MIYLYCCTPLHACVLCLHGQLTFDIVQEHMLKEDDGVVGSNG